MIPKTQNGRNKRVYADRIAANTGERYCSYHQGYVPADQARRVTVGKGNTTRWCCTECAKFRGKPRA